MKQLLFIVWILFILSCEKESNDDPLIMVAFGDSVTAGEAASDSAHMWTNIVAASKGYLLTNSGLPGTTLQNTPQAAVPVMGSATINNGRDTYSERINNYNPDIVFILYGLNDIRFAGPSFTTENFEHDLGEVIDGLLSSGILAKNIVIGSPPYLKNYTSVSAAWNGGSVTKHLQYIAKCSAVAAAKGTKYVNVYQWMIDHGGDALLGNDGIHPNDSGHSVIANAFLSVL
jgi:lysophospholipase L1-like esterase